MIVKKYNLISSQISSSSYIFIVVLSLLTAANGFVQPEPIEYRVLLAYVCHPPNGISIGLAVFAGLILVPNRQTEKHSDRSHYLLQ